MSANEELMDFALKSFMRVRDQEILALKESHKKELVALNKKFEDEKRKMVREIIDLELDNKELLRKVVELTEQADAVSIQRQEIENLKKVVDEMKDQMVILRNQVMEKDEHLRQRNNEISKQQAEMHQHEVQIKVLRKREEERVIEWLINREKSPKLRFPQCCYYLAVQCFQKGQRHRSIPVINECPVLCTDKFLEILSEPKI